MIKPPDMKFHHFGILVENLEDSARDYVENFGYEVRRTTIHDPLQAVYAQFLALPSESTYIELLMPDGPQSPLQNALKRAPGPNHVCFSTPHLEKSLEYMSAKGAMLLRPPVPAVAFRNRRIAWVMDRNCILVELLEQGPDGESEFQS